MFAIVLRASGTNSHLAPGARRWGCRGRILHASGPPSRRRPSEVGRESAFRRASVEGPPMAPGVPWRLNSVVCPPSFGLNLVF